MRAEVHHQESLGVQDPEGRACDQLLLMVMHEEGGKRERQGAGIMTKFTAKGDSNVRTD